MKILIAKLIFNRFIQYFGVELKILKIIRANPLEKIFIMRGKMVNSTRKIDNSTRKFYNSLTLAFYIVTCPIFVIFKLMMMMMMMLGKERE